MVFCCKKKKYSCTQNMLTLMQKLEAWRQRKFDSLGYELYLKSVRLILLQNAIRFKFIVINLMLIDNFILIV